MSPSFRSKLVPWVAAVFVVALVSAASSADTPSLYPWEGKRLDSVARPASVLGYEPGTRLVDHADTLRYFDALAASSDRVRLFGYARSHEGRILRYAVVSSAANLARLEEYRTAMGRLADPRGLDAAEAAEIIRRTPAFVWLAYAVHGNEHSSTEAALSVAYHLASADDERTRVLLDGAIVFIDPIQNPDGRDRFIRSYREAAGVAPVTDPAAAEHDEPWPSGRFNHDLFDMNRDWFFETQPEVRGRIAAFLAWRPLIYVDFHEMGTDQSYYFPPPARPFNPNVAESASKWFRLIGEVNARTFDALGFDYFTREVFDLFYPGYGDSWPTLSGAIGMTYEVGGAQGLAIERKDGSILTLRDAMRRHIASSLATVEMAAARREELLRDYAATRRAAIEDSGPVKSFVVSAEPDPAGAARLANLLASQGIDVGLAKEPFSTRVTRGEGDAADVKSFPAGSLLVPLAQPGRRLASALFERDVAIEESVLKDAVERRRLHGDPPFYDSTAWSLPLAMNLKSYEATETPRVSRSSLTPAPSRGLPGHGVPPAGLDPWPPPIARTIDAGGAAAAPAEAGFAYLLPPAGNGTLAAFASLVARDDLVVEVAAKSFTVGGRSYPPGTSVLKVRRNPPNLGTIIAEATRTFGAPFGTTSSGLVDAGVDLGSASVVRVKMPRIATIYGEPASPTSAGWVQFVLREQYGLKIAPIRARTLVTQADLRRYDVIILPDGSAAGYREAFGKDGVALLRNWMEAGGTMITFKGASAFAVSKGTAWVSSKQVRQPRSAPIVPAGAPEPAPAPSPAPAAHAEADPNGPDADAGDEESPAFVPGAILRVVLEPSHPLAFGYDAEVPAMISSSLVFSLARDGVNVGVFAAKERLRLGGFMWKESIDLLAGKPFVIAERRGRGTAVLFADDPDYRGGWDGLNRMLLNAVLLVPAFDN
ncbi:MAG: hypothetical protein HY049_07505 [Acidobacteria bacterium]|nr:hypothetical protein [Acidobacteriota bacterium]